MLSHGAVSLYGPAHAANKEPSRHISSGLLTQFWCFPSSVLPAMTCNAAEKVLVLGQPLPGRLLALIQLLFAPANCTDAGSHRGPLAVSADGTNIPEAAVAVSITGTETKASRSDRSEEGPGWQPGLSWNVYGEGPEPRGWGSRREAADGSRLPQKPSEGQQGAAPASWQQQQWTSVGTFVEGLLHRSIRVSHIRVSRHPLPILRASRHAAMQISCQCLCESMWQGPAWSVHYQCMSSSAGTTPLAD